MNFLVVLLFLIGSVVGSGVSYNYTTLKPDDDGGQCPCKPDETLAYSSGGECTCQCIKKRHELDCFPCPETLSPCESTCCLLDVTCDNHGVCRATDGLDFVTAAKVAVLFALVVTCLAVLVALFRAFLFPRCCNGRMRRTEPDSRSLNSVQRFVLERLTTRPPPYEHQPEKPPSYEECVDGEGAEAAPPAYGVAVINVPADPPPYSIETSQTVMAPGIGFHLPNCDGSAEGTLPQQPLDAQALAVASPVRLVDDFEMVDVPLDRKETPLQSLREGGLENKGFEPEDSNRRNIG